MAKKNVTESKFEDVCTVIDLREEYGSSFVGESPIAIVSRLDARQIREQFPKEIEGYPSFTVIAPEIYETILDFHRDDERVRAQSIAHPSVPLELAELVLVDPLGDIPVICESVIALEFIINRMLSLPDNQGSRLYRRFVLGYSVSELSSQQMVSKEAIWHSLQDGKKAIREAFIEFGGVA